MRNQKKAAKDTRFEGKNKAFLDEDRMINEGLSGGSVHGRQDSVNIEEARTLEQEAPPNSVK
ncbi:hypothetical protein [Mesobacillus harenae]|uniref:hypothetical protein n=1 Tax=Mesobacillus harenae TaxID=2213203 RepID=UPI00158128D8|nr:hypothetical protein [Mesobacillus harenae]